VNESRKEAEHQTIKDLKANSKLMPHQKQCKQSKCPYARSLSSDRISIGANTSSMEKIKKGEGVGKTAPQTEDEAKNKHK